MPRRTGSDTRDRWRGEPSFERPPFAAADRMDRADYLHPSLSVGGMSVGVYRNDGTQLGVSDTNEPAAVHMLPVMLRATPACHLWRDSVTQESPPLPPGAIGSFDLRQRWQADLSYAFHSVHFYVPQAAFDDLTDELRQPKVEHLSCRPGLVTIDPTAYHLAQALVSVVEGRTGLPGLLSDQILSALRLHLACTHGGLILPDPVEPRLSREQIKLVRELMLDALDPNLRMDDLARACRMSSHRFASAFRASLRPPRLTRGVSAPVLSEPGCCSRRPICRSCRSRTHAASTINRT